MKTEPYRPFARSTPSARRTYRCPPWARPFFPRAMANSTTYSAWMVMVDAQSLA